MVYCVERRFRKELTDVEITDEVQMPDLCEQFDQELPEREQAAETSARGLRPEAILGLLALLSAVILALMVALCIPYMQEERRLGQEAAAQRLTEPTLPQPAQTTPPEEEHDEDPERVMATEETLPSIEPVEYPDASIYGRLDFQYDRNNYLYCLRQKSYPGVDVSAFQGNIDWQKVKDSGIRFAMLRLGYRGYESGKLVEDEYIQQNLKATKEVDMPIGAYFFSQALTIKEVDEEIDFMLKVLGDYELHMPIVLDWEIPTADARTARMDARTLTALQEYFCETMVEKGYTPMIYFNWTQSNTLLYLNELEDYPFWLALYSNRMTYPYHVEMWQYTASGKVPGIQGDVDLNVYMPPEE